jgi:adenine phosphoribosyltransferase
MRGVKAQNFGLSNLKKYIRDVPDFPKKGIIFKDITTLLKEPERFVEVIDILAQRYAGKEIDKIVCVDARGFIFGGALSYRLGCGFVPVRKKGKLPYKTISVAYSLEYGTGSLEMHEDAIIEGERILIVDDLLATGGTVGAVVELIEKLKGQIVEVAFLIELEFLKGREKIKDYPVFSLIKY